MSTLADVFDGLKAMSLVQLLLAFIACAAYVLAQGGLFGRSGRRWAWASAAGSAVAFIALDREWTNAVVLVAIAVAALGWFTALVWLTTRALGIDHAALATVPPVTTIAAALTETTAAPATGTVGRRRIRARAAQT